MPYQEVPTRYDGRTLEEGVLEFWRSEDVFHKTLRASAGRPLFTFNEGPPTANGRPGLHHVLARTFKDVYPRYKTMRGYHVPRKAGWDTHGLPVEHEIEKELGIFDKKRIEEEIGIEEFTRRCRESVMRYIGEWEKMTERMGFWVDLKEAYYTLNNEYIESVWHLLKTIWDKGLIQRGYKVVPYDPRIGTTLSSHEVGRVQPATNAIVAAGHPGNDFIFDNQRCGRERFRDSGIGDWYLLFDFASFFIGDDQPAIERM